MPSSFIQRQIDELLEQAARAIKASDWRAVTDASRNVLALDPENPDARELLAAAERANPEIAAAATHGLEAAQAPNISAGDEWIPESFAGGRYTVKKFLGEGGKKKVFLAHDSLLDRDVAFALIKTEGLDSAGRDRIKREAQAMGRLGAHPHIVSVFDLGEEETGQPFIVTELMGGGDVEGLIEKAPEHRPPLDRALVIAVEVCLGLEFAHSHGIVHRDLKPGNVWLTADGRAKLGDFGLAVALDKSRLTQAGMMVGTVSYMPPEQAIGGEVTPRSDLYSLGAMLYELVTSRPPFLGDDSVAIITQHLNIAPVAPAWHNPSVPPALEALILRLLEKDPARRPASASEVQEALEGILRQAQNERGAASLSPVGEGRGDGEIRAGETGRAASDNPMYRRTFVGREPELRQLQGAYDAASSGQGSLAMVVGEPGIGKTSVCEQLSTFAAIRGGKTLIGHCYEEGSLSIPYLPFVEAMRSYVLAREPQALRQDLGSGAGEVARIVSEVRDRIDVEVSPSAGDAEEERYRLFQAVTSFLRNASLVQPLLLVLEDLHDADRGTLELLLHLARNREGARLLVVGTYRDVEVDRSHPLSGALAELRRNSNYLRVVLRGLSIDEVHRMMNALRGQDVPWSRAEAVHRQTEGNPLFIQEVLRYLVEQGLVTREGGRYRRSDAGDPDAGIPEGLRDVIGKRLNYLAPQTNQVLSMAAVIGRDFRLDALQQVAGLLEAELDAALEEAAARSLIEQRPSVGNLAFRFTHAFFRQTLYEEIFASRRLRLHQQVARALEEVYGRRAGEHAAELAEHYAQSTDRADLEKALQYSEAAAERAISVFAYGEAERHFEQALKVQDVLDPDNKSKRCDLLLALGQVILPGEEPGRALNTAAPEAFRLAEDLGNPARAARAAVLALEASIRAGGSGNLNFTSPSFSEWCQRADKYAAAGTRERIYADVCLGLHVIAIGDPGGGHVFLRRAIEAVSKSKDNGAFFMAVSWAINRLAALRDRPLRRYIAEEALRRSRQGARTIDVGTCLGFCAEFFLYRADRETAEKSWRELIELAERTRDVTLKLSPGGIEIKFALFDGRLDDVALIYADQEALSAQLGVQMQLGSAQVNNRSLMLRGEAQEALAKFAALIGRPALAVRAQCLAHLGRHEDARRLRERFGDIASDDDQSAGWLLMIWLEVAILGRDGKTAGALADRFERAEALAFDIGGLCVARLLGGAARLTENPAKARTQYQEGIEACTAVGNRPEMALTRLELAELLLESYPDERAAAIAHLDFAITEFREMKMQPSLERALRHKEVLKA
jgi:serine/threonine protein kinase